MQNASENICLVYKLLDRVMLLDVLSTEDTAILTIDPVDEIDTIAVSYIINFEYYGTPGVSFEDMSCDCIK